MIRFGWILVAIAISIHAAAWAAEPAKAPFNDVVEPTCADLMAAVRMADPGEKPSSKRQAAAEEAQDDIAVALFWLHGWHVARGEATLPVKRDWMVSELKRVVAACKAQSPDGTALVSAVATK